jgi:hypothetical protein
MGNEFVASSSKSMNALFSGLCRLHHFNRTSPIIHGAKRDFGAAMGI